MHGNMQKETDTEQKLNSPKMRKDFFTVWAFASPPFHKVWQKCKQNLFKQNTLLLRSIPDLYFPTFLTHIWCNKSYTKQGSKVRRVNIIIR